VNPSPTQEPSSSEWAALLRPTKEMVPMTDKAGSKEALVHPDHLLWDIQRKVGCSTYGCGLASF